MQPRIIGLLLLLTLSVSRFAGAADRRTDPSILTVMTFNAEFLWDGVDPEEGQANFPWKNAPDEAQEHMLRIAEVTLPDDSRSSEIQECPPTHPNYPNCTKTQIDCSQRVVASVTATPSRIRQGDSATLRWSATLPNECSSRILTLNGQRVARTGTMTVAPYATRTYPLKLGATTVASRTVVVDDMPRIVRIEGNDAEWVNYLIRALGHGDTTVLLPHDAEIDLTGRKNILIARNTVFTSEAPPIAAPIATSALGRPSWPARDSAHRGPRVFTQSRHEPLFDIRCDSAPGGDNVRISGFRIEGPTVGHGEGDNNVERGINIYACRGIEISNMEFSQWSGAALYVHDNGTADGVTDPGRNNAPGDVWIHDNFFHHNQHIGGFGYGVDLQDRGYALIERNVFDHNRHAISSTGVPGTGYLARHNLVLKGGGIHGQWWNEHTHQFDVHGTNFCIPEGPDGCGTAGERFWFTDNAFQYNDDRAIKIRGTVQVGATIERNVFAHSDIGEAVQLQDPARVQIGTNTFRVQTFGEYGVCDFDRDGKDDLFLATGVSWWFASGARMHWTFLSTHTERLSQVGLGDFNGDGTCDVFAVRNGRWEISPGGTAPWAPLPGGDSAPFDQLAFADFNGDRIQDVFRRSPEGAWSVVSPGFYAERALLGSPNLLIKLRFGDFNADGIADVLGRDEGVLAVSWGGVSDWQPLPGNLVDDPQWLSIGDVDGLPGDDLVRRRGVDELSTYEISSAAQTAWQVWFTSPVFFGSQPIFIGNFDNPGGDELIALSDRTGLLYRRTTQELVAHNVFDY